MPRISAFYGIVIALYFHDHAPPHFHALYSGDEVRVRVDTLEVLTGSLPPWASGMVMEWARLHRDDLAVAWERAQRGEHPGTIDPLP